MSASRSLPWLIILSTSILPAWHPGPAGGTSSNVHVDFSLEIFPPLSSPKSQLGDEQKSKKQSTRMNGWTNARSFCLSGAKTNKRKCSCAGVYQFVLLLLGEKAIPFSAAVDDIIPWSVLHAFFMCAVRWVAKYHTTIPFWQTLISYI